MNGVYIHFHTRRIPLAGVPAEQGVMPAPKTCSEATAHTLRMEGFPGRPPCILFVESSWRMLDGRAALRVGQPCFSF